MIEAIATSSYDDLRVQSESPAAYGVDTSPKVMSEETRQLIQRAIDAIEAHWGEPGVQISNPRDAADYIKMRCAGLEHEVFGCVFLSNRNRVLGTSLLFRGTLATAEIHPREVVKEALKHNAGQCILFHNHPSSESEPSSSDRAITSRLRDALRLIDVCILDHFVVGRGEPTSMASRGWI